MRGAGPETQGVRLAITDPLTAPVDERLTLALDSSLVGLVDTFMTLLRSDRPLRFFRATRASSVVLAAALVVATVSWAVHCLPVARMDIPSAHTPHLSCALSPQQANGPGVVRSSSDAGLDAGGQYAALAVPAEPSIAFRPTAGPPVTRTGRPIFFTSHRFLI